MTPLKIVGLAILVLGVVLLFFAWRASNAPVEQLAEALTGRYSDRTMVYLFSGIAGVVIGGAALLKGYVRLR
jgi:drug/metabolite transporter (DMT)-like permease